MRFIATSLATLAMILSANAQSLGSQAVALFKEGCTEAMTPEAMVATGQKLAKTQNWQLEKFGPMPLPMLHNEKGPNISYGSLWKLDLPALSNVQLYMTIVRPEIAGVRHSGCSLFLPVEEYITENLVSEINLQFGAKLARDYRSREPNWYFSNEMSAGNCGKTISVSQSNFDDEGKRNTLGYVDLAYPNDGNWTGARSGTVCRR